MTKSMKFETWVKKGLDYLKPVFYADEYAFTVVMVDRFEGDGDSGAITLATVKVSPTYLVATLKVGKALKEMWENDPEAAGEVLVHEMSHLLTQPLWELLEGKASDQEQYFYEQVLERQTQRIANTVTKLLPAKWWLLK